jgi:hypothetical protein
MVQSLAGKKQGARRQGLPFDLQTGIWEASIFELMKLPNPGSVIIEHEKVVHYLLNPAHPDNGGKAAFFLSLGFSLDDWQSLAMAFRTLAGRAEVTKSVETNHGCKYIVEGRIETPGGRTPSVRTIWIVDRGADVARLVSAYPCQE